MAHYTKENQEQHIELVRNTLAMLPSASVARIKQDLESRGVVLNHKYIIKLRKKVMEQRMTMYSDKLVINRIAEMRDTFEKLKEEMWNIVNDKKAKRMDKIQAADKVIKAEKALLDAEMDAGIFKRQIGEVLHRDIRDIADGEQKLNNIINAIKANGYIVARPVEIIEARTEEPQEVDEDDDDFPPDEDDD